MPHTSWRQPCFVWCCWLLIALLLNFGPASLYSRVENLVLNSEGLSLKIIGNVHSWITRSESSPSGIVENSAVNDLEQFDSELIALRKQNRDLTALLATLQSENHQLKSIPNLNWDASSLKLQTVSAVPGNVLGRVNEQKAGQNKLLISLGERAGLVGDELILEGTGILIDQGELESLSTDQLVTFGRSLFGKTIRVGTWTSLVQPISDPEFRTAVQLIRKSDFGVVSGAKGILQGTGNGCQVIEVAGTEAVAVGDLVYTDPSVSPTGTPIYCGRVTEANISSNSAHWTIFVKSEVPYNSVPKKLTVIRSELNLKKE